MGVEQEFAVALGARYRAFDDTDRRPARLLRDPRSDTFADSAMDCRIAHDPALADLLATGLKLWLDECYQLGSLGGEGERGR